MMEKENVPLNLSLPSKLSSSTINKRNEKNETSKPKCSKKETFLVNWINTILAKPEQFNANLLGVSNTENEMASVDNMQIVLDSVRVSSGFKAIHNEVQDGGFIMRSDSDLYKNLVNQQALFEILDSYEEEYLLFGLNAIIGEAVPKNGFLSKKNIHAFVCEKILSSKRKPVQENHIKKSNKLIIKKIFQLVLYLDVARESMALPNLCLFNKTAICKSSKDIAIHFCKNFLQGEGDIIRHLGVLGVKLNFEQTYVHEFDYATASVFNDLKDGVRLARLIEILSGARGLSNCLRVPPVSRLQKLHNVGVCIAKVYTPTEEQPESKCIVEGNPEKTVAFLTRIINMYDADTAGKL
mgnify:CR=1 FL=1